MRLDYRDTQQEGHLVLTNFNCGPAQHLLSEAGYLKILWAREATQIVVDGYQRALEAHEVLFATTSNVLEIPMDVKMLALVFNKDFYCIQDHDEEVSCNGFLFYGSSEPSSIHLTDQQVTSFDAIFLLLKEEFEIKDNVQGEMLRVLLKRLLITSTRLLREKMGTARQPTETHDLVRQFKVLLEANYRSKHKVQDYADLLFKSPKTLSNQFKTYGEPAPLLLIQDRLALEAKRLLRFSNKYTEEIAHELGYQEASHFSRFFKKHTGSSPTAYRASCK